jgi:Leucine-rich repeat (LRR) protein
MPNLRTLKIQSNDITELEPGRVSNVPNLQYLHLQRSKIAKLAYETPLCPENCTINTYYDPDNHVCLSCPENTYRDGIGAVDCTTTPVPLCGGETSPFILANDTLCVPNNLYPAPNVAHCVFEHTWRDLRSMQVSFSTGGLGRLMTDSEWEVWVCMEHPCATDKDDTVCFTYSEAHHVFVPWGYKSHLTFLKK